MFKNGKVQTLIVLSAGILTGYIAAAGKLDVFHEASASPSKLPQDAVPNEIGGACCSEGLTKGQLVALAGQGSNHAVARAETQSVRSPTSYSSGDDIGVAEYQRPSRGLMAGQNAASRQARRRACFFTDYYGSKLHGGSRNFITAAADPHRHDHGWPGGFDDRHPTRR